MKMEFLDGNRSFREKIERCRRLIVLNPKDAQNHFELGCLLKSLGRRQEALQEWKKTIQIDANNLQARRAIQDLLEDSDSNRGRSARR